MTTPENPSRSALYGLVAFGWNERVAQLMPMFPDRIPGRVVRVDRIRYRVATAQGITDAYAGPHDRGSESGAPVTGDWVGLTVGTDQRAYVAAILPRSSAIKRLDPSTAGSRPQEQVLVANLDVVFVVHALDRPTQLSRLERTLVMAWESGATPVLVLDQSGSVDRRRGSRHRKGSQTDRPGGRGDRRQQRHRFGHRSALRTDESPGLPERSSANPAAASRP